MQKNLPLDRLLQSGTQWFHFADNSRRKGRLFSAQAEAVIRPVYLPAEYWYCPKGIQRETRLKIAHLLFVRDVVE